MHDSFFREKVRLIERMISSAPESEQPALRERLQGDWTREERITYAATLADFSSEKMTPEERIAHINEAMRRAGDEYDLGIEIDA